MNQMHSEQYEIEEWTAAIRDLLKDPRSKRSVKIYKGYNMCTMCQNITVNTLDYCITLPVTSRELSYSIEKFTAIVLEPVANFINMYEENR